MEAPRRHSGGNPQPVSPYLNFDPAYIDQSSQYIYPEGANRQRGRLEKAFSQIGGSVLAGGTLGGMNGMYQGLNDKEAKQLTSKLWRTQLLNYVGKNGAKSAQSLGVIALMYSLFGVAISWGRGADDELNTLAAGTATGALYKSSAGWKKCLRGGAVGFALALAYVCCTSRDRMKTMLKMD